ncbi:MAG: CPBP family intramembrane glutamic endopeptidase, partial [Phycisphaerae bacterium]
MSGALSLRSKLKRARGSAGAPPRHASYWEFTRRPLQCAAFLTPLIVAYEAAAAWSFDALTAAGGSDLAAPQLLNALFQLLGASGYFLPGFALVSILFAWHVAARQPWRVQWRGLPVMAAESMLWALPLLLMSDLIRLTATTAASVEPSLLREVVLGLGAGIYEELLFRLCLMSLIMYLVVDVARGRAFWGAAAAVVVSSLLFAAHHYPPIGTDVFERVDFAFRFLAGGYLAV